MIWSKIHQKKENFGLKTGDLKKMSGKGKFDNNYVRFWIILSTPVIIDGIILSIVVYLS
jgi:hypothetical protein